MKQKFLDLFLESLSKTISFAGNFKQGLSFITFSYKSGSGQFGSIVPIFTNKKSSLQSSVLISKKNINWWYLAWNSIYKQVQSEQKEDLFRFQFIHILTSLKNKESIWIIPFSAKPQINKFFVTLGLKLKSIYSFHSTTKDPFLGNLNFAVFIKKGVSQDIVLNTIGEKTLLAYFKQRNNDQEFTGQSIIEDIKSKLGSDPTSEILEDLSKYFNNADQEELIINLFEKHSPYSTLAKLSRQDLEATPEEKEVHELPVEPHEIPETTEEEEDSRKGKEEEEVSTQEKPPEEEKPTLVATKEKTTTTTTTEQPKETPEEEEATPGTFNLNTFTNSALVAEDSKTEFKKDHSAILKEVVNSFPEEKKVSITKSIEDYTATGFRLSNIFLSTNFIEKTILKENNSIDLTQDHSIEDLKSKIPEATRNSLAVMLHSTELFDVMEKTKHKKYDHIIATIKNLLELFDNSKSILNKDIITFRGVPVRNSKTMFKSDVWLRNPSKEGAGNTHGLFQKDIANAIGGQSLAQASDILKDFYNVGNEVSSEPFFSSSIDYKIANGFSTNQNDWRVGHLFAIKLPRGLKGLFISSLSLVQSEDELLLPPESKFRLLNVQPRNLVKVPEKIPNFNETLDSDSPELDTNSMVFSLEYLGSDGMSKGFVEKRETFWNNLIKLFSE